MEKLVNTIKQETIKQTFNHLVSYPQKPTNISLEDIISTTEQYSSREKLDMSLTIARLLAWIEKEFGGRIRWLDYSEVRDIRDSLKDFLLYRFTEIAIKKQPAPTLKSKLYKWLDLINLRERDQNLIKYGVIVGITLTIITFWLAKVI